MADRSAFRSKYSEEQLAFVSVLIKDEKCTVGMIKDLTGIPRGTIGALSQKLNSPLPNTKGAMGGKTGAVNRARKTARLKVKYVQQLAMLFNKT